MIRFVVLLLSLVLSCCQNQPHSPLSQTIRVNICTDPQTLDPRKARDLATVTLMHMLFEGLARTSRSGDVELALAKDVQITEDGLQYTFMLRPSVWSDGSPLTSFDFEKSWKSVLDPSFPTDIAYQLYPIKNGRKAKLGEVSLEDVGIFCPDSTTLVVTLEKPAPYFIELLSTPAFFPVPPKAIKQDAGLDLDPAAFVGNGPFRLKTWAHSNQIEVVKNLSYWEKDKVSIEKIELLMVSDDTEMRMFEGKKLDWAGSPLSTIPVDAVQTLRSSKKLHSNPFSATFFFRTNTAHEIKGQKNPLANSNFRKALAYALDREAITKHILQGGQSSATSLVPFEMGLADAGYFPDHAVDQARIFLQSAQSVLGTIDPITISYSSNERSAAIAQAVQKQWEANLGIKVLLEAVEPKIYFARISQKDYQIAASSWTADFNDPINFLEVFKYKDASTNNTNWESGIFIDLLDRSGVCRNKEERRELLREAEKTIMSEMPIIPIFHFALNYLQKDNLKDVVLSPLGQIDFRWAHLDSSEVR